MSLSTDFTSQLQSFNDCLLLTIESFPYIRFFNLHRQELAHNFDDLVIRRLKPESFISFFIYPRL